MEKQCGRSALDAVVRFEKELARTSSDLEPMNAKKMPSSCRRLARGDYRGDRSEGAPQSTMQRIVQTMLKLLQNLIKMFI